MDPRGDDLSQLGSGASEDARFDASQYAFFGNDVVEEVELGGLEEDEEENVAFAGDEEFQFSSLDERAEGESLGSLSEIDDLAGAFSKLNNVGRAPKNAVDIRERDACITESSSGTDWLQDFESSDWLEQKIREADDLQKRWQSQQPSSAFADGTKPLQRTSTYPQQHPRDSNVSDQILVPNSPFMLSHLPGGRSYTPPHERFQPSISPDSAHLQMPISAPNTSFSTSQPHFATQNRLQFLNSMDQFIPPVLPINANQRNRPMSPDNLFPRDQSSLFQNILPQKLPHPNGLPQPSRPMNLQMFPQQEKQRFVPIRSSQAHAMHLHPQLSSSHYLSPPMMNKTDPMRGMVDVRDERSKFTQKGRVGLQFSQQYFDISRQKNDPSWPQFKAKYMSPEEIENIMRMQHAATHSNDPYIDDYYHQACLAKRSARARMKHHFCPASILDLPSRTRSNNEPHPYLHVDALGRIAFSSVRRPRPLLEVNSTSRSDDKGTDKKFALKPLEEEPMLGARIVIEECLCLILDIDDIDRVLQFNQPPDGGSQLRQRRMMLLEGTAASLQLVDPFGPTKAGQPVVLAPKDDLVFLRIASLPKGRKLLWHFLQLLLPGSELTRVICMAIFRHLRFLFGGPQADPSVAETTGNLSRAVSFCVCGMDLNALSACLAAIVCSTEKPPLRPVGGSLGDGASVIVKSVLVRATALLSDPHASQNLSMSNRALWQESFNAFFKLLTDYCFEKYDSVVRSMHGHKSDSAVTSDVARAISKEMPIELLRASLPHTDEQQRKLLLDFAQRSMPK